MTIAGKRTRTSLSPSRIFRLGILATGLRARDVGNETVPVTVGNVGAASVVFITPGAQSVYDRFERNGYL